MTDATDPDLITTDTLERCIEVVRAWLEKKRLPMLAAALEAEMRKAVGDE